MYEEEIHFRKLLILAHLTLVTPVSIGFLCCLGWMSGQSWRKAGQGVIELMI